MSQAARLHELSPRRPTGTLEDRTMSATMLVRHPDQISKSLRTGTPRSSRLNARTAERVRSASNPKFLQPTRNRSWKPGGCTTPRAASQLWPAEVHGHSTAARGGVARVRHDLEPADAQDEIHNSRSGSARGAPRVLEFVQGGSRGLARWSRLFGAVNTVPGGGQSRRLSPPWGWSARCLGSALV